MKNAWIFKLQKHPHNDDISFIDGLEKNKNETYENLSKNAFTR